MKNRVFGLFVAAMGVAILSWTGYGMLVEQKSIEDKVTQGYVLISVIYLSLGLEVWHSGSTSKQRSNAARQIIGRTCWIVCIAMLAFAAFRVVSPSIGWIGFGIGVLGNLIGWGKPLVTTNEILGRQ